MLHSLLEWAYAGPRVERKLAIKSISPGPACMPNRLFSLCHVPNATTSLPHAPKPEPGPVLTELEELRAENARLRERLAQCE